MIKRLRYILIKLKTIQFKEMVKIAKKIKVKAHKPVLLTLIDMTIAALRYGCGYMDYFEFEFYLLNGQQRATYITGSINSAIVAKYNNKDYFYIFEEKSEFNHRFQEFIGRGFLRLDGDNYPAFRDFIAGKARFIVKPNNNSCGIGVEVYQSEAISDQQQLYQKLLDHDQTLIEDFIVQDPRMNTLYASSVNTLRVISFRKETEVHILKVILKIGNGGLVDNFSSGGMYTFVDQQGIVFVPAIDEAGNIYETHPLSGQAIVGFRVPQYPEVCELVRKLGLVVPEVPYVGWDIAVTPRGPVVVEGNNFSGIFQVKPSISGIKTGDLPNFRRYMEM